MEPIGNPLLVKCLEFQSRVPAWSVDLPHSICNLQFSQSPGVGPRSTQILAV